MGDAVKPLLCLVDEYVDQIKFQLNVIVFFFLSDRQIYLFFSNFDAVIEDFGQSEFIFVFFFNFQFDYFISLEVQLSLVSCTRVPSILCTAQRTTQLMWLSMSNDTQHQCEIINW